MAFRFAQIDGGNHLVNFILIQHIGKLSPDFRGLYEKGRDPPDPVFEDQETEKSLQPEMTLAWVLVLIPSSLIHCRKPRGRSSLHLVGTRRINLLYFKISSEFLDIGTVGIDRITGKGFFEPQKMLKITETVVPVHAFCLTSQYYVKGIMMF